MRLRQVRSYLARTPWAITEDALETITQIVAYHTDNGSLSADELEARLEAARARKPAPVQAPGQVAVLPIDGVIVPKADAFSAVSGATSLESFTSALTAAAGDPNVAAIVLNIDSPGGSTDLVTETAAAIRAAAKRKPVVAIANTMADSAAYWLATQATEIVASPSAEVGAIGVIAMHQDLTGAEEKAGIKTTLITAGPHKGELSPFQPLSEEAQAAAQHRVDQMYGMFVRDVARGRGVDVATVQESFGGGRSLSAQDALAAGMVDRIETLDQTLTRILGGTAPPSRSRALEPIAGTVAYFPDGSMMAGSATADTGFFDATALPELALLAGPIPYRKTGVVDQSWDKSSELAKLPQDEKLLRQMHAWVDSGADPALKGSYKFPHHMVSDPDGGPGNGDETVGPANVNAVRDGLARLDQAHVPEGDVAGIKAHLQQHLDDFNSASPSASSGSDKRDDRRATAATKTKETRTMRTIEQLVARQDEIKTRQQEIDAEYVGEALPDDARGEFDALEAEHAENHAVIEDNARRKALIEAKRNDAAATEHGAGIYPGKPVGAITSSGRRIPENIFALDEYRGRASNAEELGELYRDGARRAVEGAYFPHPRANQEDSQGRVERLLAGDTLDGQIARRVLATGSPVYERAFGKMLVGRPLNNGEQHALATYGLNITTDADGGFAIPFTLDPTVVPTSNGAVNPWREIASVKQITGNVWKGVSSDGVSVAYEAEATEVADGAPTLAQPSIDVEKAQVFVRYSIEVEQDWAGMRGELAQMIQDAKDVKEANKFAVGAGHGTHEPHGVIAAATGIDSTAALATLALADLDKVDDNLEPRFEPKAVWVANKAFYNKIRELTNQNFDLWMPLMDGIQKRGNGSTGRTLLGYEAYRCSEISSAVGTSTSKVAILGDFSYMVIVDRIGMSLEVVQHLMGANGRPTGERGLYGYFRNSSDIVSSAAFRVLEIQ